MQEPEATEHGLSLIELLVSMMLLGIVLAMATGLYISTTRTVTLSQSLNDSTQVASNAANELSRVVRVATMLKVAGQQAPESAFQYAGREGLILYSNVDVDPYASVAIRPTRPTLVKFEIDSRRQLIERRWTATASTRTWLLPSPTTTATSSRNLGASFLAPDTDAALFSYFDASGTPIVAPASGSMSSTDYKLIASIQITVKVQAQVGSNGRPVIVQNRIELPNIRAVSP